MEAERENVYCMCIERSGQREGPETCGDRTPVFVQRVGVARKAVLCTLIEPGASLPERAKGERSRE